MSDANANAIESNQAQDFEFEPSNDNPHNLSKQLIAFVIFSVLFAFFTSPVILVAGIFTFIDAWTAGIYKDKNKKSFLNLSPAAWAIAMEGLLIVTLPLYIINRNKLKTKDGNIAWFVLTIIAGCVPLIAFLINVFLVMNGSGAR